MMGWIPDEISVCPMNHRIPDTLHDQVRDLSTKKQIQSISLPPTTGKCCQKQNKTASHSIIIKNLHL